MNAMPTHFLAGNNTKDMKTISSPKICRRKAEHDAGDGRITEARRSGKPAAKPRAVLTREDVMAIFRLSMPNNTSFDSTAKKRPSAVAVAVDYAVSEKTIRDIWTGRTW
jgi:hypothetical protein